jgi:glycosyltransferase involved in cell wall biosynthesis
MSHKRHTGVLTYRTFSYADAAAVFDSKDIAAFVSTRQTPRLSEAGCGPAAGAAAPSSAAQLRFSVVMPSYGHARFIRRSIHSVLNQNHPGTELIVIDGGSSDGTQAILEEYGPEIAYWRSERDRGQSDALNKGFRRAGGDIFGWLNSDDIYLPGAFADVERFFIERPEVQVVYGDWYTIDADDRITERFLGLSYSRRRLITEGFFCNAQSMFWRRALHQRLGDFDLRLHYTMDYDLMLRMTTRAPARAFLRIDRPLGCFRVYAGQKTGAANEKVAQEHRLIAQRAGTDWKYAHTGRLLRQYFRGKRVVEHLWRGRIDYLWSRLMARLPPPPHRG